MATALSRETTTSETRTDILELHLQAQHALLVVSVIVLALTGLPQKFDSLEPSRWVMDGAGGAETLRLIHHAAAGVFIFAGLYHVALVSFAVLVDGLMLPLRTIPNARDFRDAIQMVRYFLGLRRERVALNGPSYFRKIDYWTVFWAFIVMAASGVAVLFPVRAARLLSGEVVVSALEVHSDAALIVTVWFLVVHLIYVGLAPTLFPFGEAIFSRRPARDPATLVSAARQSAIERRLAGFAPPSPAAEPPEDAR